MDVQAAAVILAHPFITIVLMRKWIMAKSISQADLQMLGFHAWDKKSHGENTLLCSGWAISETNNMLAVSVYCFHIFISAAWH